MAGYLNINPIQYLSDAQIEAQVETDLIAFQKKTGRPLSFPIYPDEIAEQLWGIKVEYPEALVDENGHQVLACFIPSEKKIKLNVSLAKNKGRTSFSMAHEVGHVSLHSFLPDFSPEGVKEFCRSVVYDHTAEEQAVQIERQADKYASLLLMPKHEILKALTKLGVEKGTPLDIALHGDTLCARFSVSAQALEIRLANMAVEVKNPRYPEARKKYSKPYISDAERADWSFKESTSVEGAR